MKIYLIGYMYSGKTVVAHHLARALGYQFVDLDQYFESQLKTSIPIFFQRYGEKAFRILEQKMLHDTEKLDNIVIATGGGTPCYFDNMEWINANGISVYLQSDVDLTIRRLIPSKKKRPILQNKSPEELRTFIREQLAQRMPFYTQAQYTFDAGSPDVVKAIVSTIEPTKR